MNTLLRFFGGFFLFGALTRALEARPLAATGGLLGLFMTSMTIITVAFLTGFAGAHPLITGGSLLVINFLGAANLVRQANPDSSLFARALVGGIGTFLITNASSYVAGLAIGLTIVALQLMHIIR